MSADAWYDCPKCIESVDPTVKAALDLVQSKGFRLERSNRAEEFRTDTMRQDGEVYYSHKKKKFCVDVTWYCTKCSYTRSIEVEQDV